MLIYPRLAKVSDCQRVTDLRLFVSCKVSQNGNRFHSSKLVWDYAFQTSTL